VPILLKVYVIKCHAGAYLGKITPMASTEIAFYIYYLIIIIVSLDIHVYVYYMVIAKLLQEMYFRKIVFMTFPYGNIRR
jgi:hypothetical protein